MQRLVIHADGVMNERLIVKITLFSNFLGNDVWYPTAPRNISN